MNKIEKYLIEESSNKYSAYGTDKEYLEPADSFIFAIQKSQRINIIQGEICSYTENIFDILSENREKEVFYIKAIENLIKQREYIKLLYQVSNELISDDEFSRELDENENKYLIKIDKVLDRRNYKIVHNIAQKINAVFTDDDISEIFSLRSSEFENLLIDDK